MSNPDYPVNCPKDQYTKIATCITGLKLHKMKTDAIYLWTYRLTGEAAPTLRNEAVRIFVTNLELEEISSQNHIDLYIWCDNEDGILRTSAGSANPVPSIVPGSTVWSNRTVELIKLGHMFVVQKVFQGLTNAATTDFLLDLSAVTSEFLVLYEINFSVSLGKAIGIFYEKGNYAGGTNVPINKKNENKAQLPKSIITIDPVGTVPGPEGTSYLSGNETQGVFVGGGGSSDKDTPTEINTAISRIFRIVQTGGTGIFDLELRLLFAEIP